MSGEDEMATIYRQNRPVALAETAICGVGFTLSVLSFQLGIIDLKWQIGGIAICGLLTIVFAVQLIRRQPELVLTDDGIQVVRYGHIAWTEIHSAQLLSRSGEENLYRAEFVLRDVDATLAHVPRFVRWCMHPARDSPKHHIIDAEFSGIPVTAQALTQALLQRRPTLSVTQVAG
ncbi:hypothetical protein [Nocardia sp. NPDC050406]|uniref:hypothetical protein n=1 Tax=Nocardia sp. NPDC050406 TaxID=3364318 RepID=UPI00378A7079